MRKKRFLFIHGGINSEGRWGRTFPLAVAVAKHGYEVTILTTRNKNQKGLLYSIDFIRGVKIISFNDIFPKILLSRGYGFLSFWGRVIYVLKHKFDYVYSDWSETPNAGWIAKISQKCYGALFISEWGDMLERGGHYDYKPIWFKLLFGKYYLWSVLYFRRSADIVVVLSEYMKLYAETKGILDRKIVVVPGGALCDVLRMIPVNKSSLNLEENIITFGYIDSTEILNIMPLMSVLQKPQYQHKFKIITFGKRVGNELIEKYNLQDLLIEKGWIDYYKDQSDLQLVDILLLIKTNIHIGSAGWPNKLGDYMAVGRPVMVTPYGDIRKFVDENKEGFIEITLDEFEIESELDKIIAGYYNLKYMGQVNREIAEKKISWNIRANTLISFISEYK
jgi:glycosyltransferase involved in cell wall biosynthesis